MQFKTPSGELIKQFLPKIDECKTKQNKTRLNKLLSIIYNDICEGDHYVSSRIGSGCLRAQIHRLSNDSRETQDIFQSILSKTRERVYQRNRKTPT